MPVIKILVAILITMPLGAVGCERAKLETDKKAVLFMDKYHGPTVTVSGKAVFPDYESGEIAISVSSKSQFPTDIMYF